MKKTLTALAASLLIGLSLSAHASAPVDVKDLHAVVLKAGLDVWQTANAPLTLTERNNAFATLGGVATLETQAFDGIEKDLKGKPNFDQARFTDAKAWALDAIAAAQKQAMTADRFTLEQDTQALTIRAQVIAMLLTVSLNVPQAMLSDLDNRLRGLAL